VDEQGGLPFIPISLGAIRKDRFAIIVFCPRSLRDCSKFDTGDFLLFDEEAGPTAVVFPGGAALQK
jgi:hypothetical protein